MGSVVESENGASHNRHNAVNRTLFPLHYSQNWDKTTFLIMSFGKLTPRRIITKGWYFFTIFFVVIETSVTVTYIFWSSLSSLQLFVHYEKIILGEKAIVEWWLLRILFVNFPILQWSDSGRQTKVGAINREQDIFGQTSLVHTAKWFWVVYVSWVYECTKRIYIPLI